MEGEGRKNSQSLFTSPQRSEGTRRGGFLGI